LSLVLKIITLYNIRSTIWNKQLLYNLYNSFMFQMVLHYFSLHVSFSPHNCIICMTYKIPKMGSIHLYLELTEKLPKIIITRLAFRKIKKIWKSKIKRPFSIKANDVQKMVKRKLFFFLILTFYCSPNFTIKK